MIKVGRKKKKNRLPPFVAITKEMLRSAAWESLSNAERVAYLHLRAKCMSANSEEMIACTYREMEKIMDRHTFRTALLSLVEYGFIVIHQRGGLHRKRNFYAFSEQWKNIQVKGQKQVLFFTPSTVGISTPSITGARL